MTDKWNTFRYKMIEKGFEVFDLNSADYYTILDLLEFSRIESDEKLKNLTAILLCLFSSLKDGSLCLKLNEEVVRNKLDLITANEDESIGILDNFLREVEEYNNIISINGNNVSCHMPA